MIGEVLLHIDYEDTEEFKRAVDNKTLEFMLMYFRQRYKQGKIEVETELIKGKDKDSKIIIKNINNN